MHHLTARKMSKQMRDMTPGIYSNKKQRRYKDKEPNEALVRAIMEVVPKEESIVDLGAGCGWFVKRLRKEGWTIDGVDGTPGIWSLSEKTVMEYDLLSDRKLQFGYHWGLFSDVGEHVPREHEQKLIDNICKIPMKGLMISWGFPHERGYHHVNCRTQVYVACEFAKRGWMPDDELTQRARDASQHKFHHIRLFVATRQK